MFADLAQFYLGLSSQDIYFHIYREIRSEIETFPIRKLICLHRYYYQVLNGIKLFISTNYSQGIRKIMGKEKKALARNTTIEVCNELSLQTSLVVFPVSGKTSSPPPYLPVTGDCLHRWSLTKEFDEPKHYNILYAELNELQHSTEWKLHFRSY